jgi:hypothetical protein
MAVVEVFLNFAALQQDETPDLVKLLIRYFPLKTRQSSKRIVHTSNAQIWPHSSISLPQTEGRRTEALDSYPTSSCWTIYCFAHPDELRLETACPDFAEAVAREHMKRVQIQRDCGRINMFQLYVTLVSRLLDMLTETRE